MAIINATSNNASFTAPNLNVTLRFRFTATDSGNASDSADVQVLVSQQGGGGGGGGRRRWLRGLRIRHLRGYSLRGRRLWGCRG